MKKITSILLVLVLLLGLCACTVSIEPVNVAEKDDEGTDEPGTEEPVSYEEMTLAQKFEHKAFGEYEFEPLAEADGTMAPAQDAESGSWGFIDKTGKWVIEAKYSGATPFINDVASVLDGYNCYRYINRSGKTVVSTIKKTSIAGLSHYSEGLIALQMDVDTQQKYVYADESGNLAFDASNMPKEKKLSYESKNYFDLATPFRNGMAIATRMLNSSLSSHDKTYSAYIIDKKGRTVRTLPSGLDPMPSGFDENMLVIVKNTDNLYGLCNEYGQLITTCRYTLMFHCDGEYYLACDANGFWGFLNKEGTIVIPFKYQNALPFSEGLAAVYDGEHWGFINEEGEYVLASEYDDVKALNQADPDSDLGNGAFCCSVAAVKVGNYWGLINTSGDIIATLYSDECPFTSAANGCISFTYKEHVGLIAADGTILIAPTFGAIGEFR